MGESVNSNSFGGIKWHYSRICGSIWYLSTNNQSWISKLIVELEQAVVNQIIAMATIHNSQKIVLFVIFSLLFLSSSPTVLAKSRRPISVSLFYECFSCCWCCFHLLFWSFLIVVEYKQDAEIREKKLQCYADIERYFQVKLHVANWVLMDPEKDSFFSLQFLFWESSSNSQIYEFCVIGFNTQTNQ